MVSSSKMERAKFPRPNICGSRVPSIPGIRGLKIYTEEEVDKKNGGAGVVSRKPVSMTSTKAFVLSEMHSNKENCKSANDVHSKSNVVKLKAGRTALANIRNFENTRIHESKMQQNSVTKLKKDSTGKGTALKSKLRSAKFQLPRKSLTKSTTTVESSSSKVVNHQANNKAGHILEKRQVLAGKSKDFSIDQPIVGAKARILEKKRSLCEGGKSSINFPLRRPSLPNQRSACLNISPKKTCRLRRYKGCGDSKTKLMVSRNGSGNPFLIDATDKSSLQNVKSKQMQNIVDENKFAGTKSSMDHNSPPQSRQKCRRRRSYTFSLMTGAEVIGWCNSKMDELPEIYDRSNPLEVVDYIDEIYEHYWCMEDQTPSLENYMVYQQHISPKLRAVLVNWLIEMHQKFSLMYESLFLMIQLLDRALSVIPIRKDELQLVGLTVLLLASKYEDFWHPKVKDLISSSICSYTRRQILAMEMLILTRLKFRLNLPTPYVFMLRCLKASQSEEKLENLAYYLIELCLVEYAALRFKPSLLCASAIYLARCTLQVHPAWSHLLRKHARYEEKDLRECATMILGFQRCAGTSQLEVTYQKFLDPAFDCVAKIKAIEKLPE